MSSNGDTKSTVKSNETLFQIVELLGDHDELGVTEIAEQVEMSKSAVYKHLHTLHAHGYVENYCGRYRLGFKFLTLGGKARAHNPVCRYARQVVHDLSTETQKNTSFIVKDGDYGVIACISEDRYGLRRTVPLGDRYPLHQNAAGKAMLASLPDDEVEAILSRVELDDRTENTITDREQLFEELDTIREQGYATSESERIQGVQAIAAVVSDSVADTVGAISLAGAAHKLMKRQIEDRYADVVLEKANEIELRLQYRD